MTYTLGQITGDITHLTNGDFLLAFLEEATEQLGNHLMYCSYCGAIAKQDKICPYCDADDRLESLSGSAHLMALRLDQGLLQRRQIKQAHFRTLYGPTPFYELEYVKEGK